MALADLSNWDRRAFLGFLAASPLAGGLPDVARRLMAAQALTQQGTPPNSVQRGLITEVEKAVDVFDFEAVAQSKLPPAHWGYLATGVDGEATLRANRDGFARLGLRARRLVDVSQVDTTSTLLGQALDHPVFVCPTSSNRAFHPDGELAVARAAKAKKHLQMLSTVATLSIEDAIAARGEPVWFQFYPPRDWDMAKKMIVRAEAAGSPVVLLTVDLNAGSNRSTMERGRQMDTRNCVACHDGTPAGQVRRKPMFDGIGAAGVPYSDPAMTWEIIKRLRDTVKMKVVVKGIVTREDTELALRHGVDGVYVSNHGGRADDGGIGTIGALPEVVAAARGRVPVFMDSGVRRGSDVVKALGLGASAVGIGRAYLWGLAAFGQAGVERVLDLLRAETLIALRHVGATKASGVPRSAVVTLPVAPPNGRA
ncbi:MAG: alpha-hydroxy-acid oxidizing protein [Gemmatimonadetes bacterium]|nr:alpha-hydroxy-acid oxidizing protein [Gemmatimonadota bacterium]